MLSEELIELTSSITQLKSETQTVEVKAAHGGCPKRLYDTLSSFSNQDGGGIILFGLDETKGFEAVGVYDVHDLQKKVTEQCNQMVPPARAVFTVAKYYGLDICSAEIPSVDITERPCYYAGAGKVKGSYVRVGDADLPMTDYEIYSYEAFKKHVHDDERPIERATFDLLRKEELEKYILTMKINKPGFSKLSDEQVYEMLSISRNGIPTLAAVMNFGIYPQGYLPQMAIIAVVVPGENLGDLSNQGARFLDNKRIEGTLIEMLDGAIAFCQRNMKVETIINPQTGNREDVTEYPINAIREIILNALIHRDYSQYTEGTPIQIYFYSNRLEIHSPGGLYGRMTVEDLGHSRPDLRNPVLATMSESLLNTENRYSGIPTIYREMRKMNLPDPVFQNLRNEFVVTLYNQRKEEQHIDEKDDYDQLLEFCQIPRSRQEIMGFLNIKTTSYVTNKYIVPLIKEGRLEMTIPEKPRSRYQKYYTLKE